MVVVVVVALTARVVVKAVVGAMVVLEILQKLGATEHVGTQSGPGACVVKE